MNNPRSEHPTHRALPAVDFLADEARRADYTFGESDVEDAARGYVRPFVQGAIPTQEMVEADTVELRVAL